MWSTEGAVAASTGLDDDLHLQVCARDKTFTYLCLIKTQQCFHVHGVGPQEKSNREKNAHTQARALDSEM